MKIVAGLLLAVSSSGCFSLARRSWQEVDVATNVPAVVEFNGARGQSAGGGSVTLQVPRSRETPQVLRVVPADGRPPFTMEVAPQRGAGINAGHVLLGIFDLALIVPALVDLELGYVWGWPTRIEVVFPDGKAAPHLGKVLRG